MQVKQYPNTMTKLTVYLAQQVNTNQPLVQTIATTVILVCTTIKRKKLFVSNAALENTNNLPVLSIVKSVAKAHTEMKKDKQIANRVQLVTCWAFVLLHFPLVLSDAVSCSDELHYMLDFWQCRPRLRLFGPGVPSVLACAIGSWQGSMCRLRLPISSPVCRERVSLRT